MLECLDLCLLILVLLLQRLDVLALKIVHLLLQFTVLLVQFVDLLGQVLINGAFHFRKILDVLLLLRIIRHFAVFDLLLNLLELVDHVFFEGAEAKLGKCRSLCRLFFLLLITILSLSYGFTVGSSLNLCLRVSILALFVALPVFAFCSGFISLNYRLGSSLFLCLRLSIGLNSLRLGLLFCFFRLFFLRLLLLLLLFTFRINGQSFPILLLLVTIFIYNLFDFLNMCWRLNNSLRRLLLVLARRSCHLLFWFPLRFEHLLFAEEVTDFVGQFIHHKFLEAYMCLNAIIGEFILHMHLDTANLSAHKVQNDLSHLHLAQFILNLVLLVLEDCDGCLILCLRRL